MLIATTRKTICQKSSFMIASLIELALTLFTAVAPTAQAEPLLYFCDAENNQIVIQRFSTEEEDDTISCDIALLEKARIRFKVFDPWKFITTDPDGDHIKSTSTFRRTCRLQDETYKIEVTPLPGNYNIQGRCGATMGASVNVYKQKTKVAGASFGANCYADSPETVSLTVRKGVDQPLIKQLPNDENYVLDLQEHGSWRNVTAFDALTYKACKSHFGEEFLWKYAIEGRDEEAIRVLIAESQKTQYWGDALIEAIQARDNNLLEKLLASGANPNERPNFKTALQQAVCTPGGATFVDTLLRYGAKNSIGDYGEDALYEAISCNEMDILEKLLASGAKLDTRNIGMVLMQGNDVVLAEAFTLLIKHGFNPNFTVTTKVPHFESVAEHNGTLVIQTGPDPVSTTVNRSFVDTVKAYNKPELLKVLIKAGAIE
jgi:hypothetical protein